MTATTDDRLARFAGAGLEYVSFPDSSLPFAEEIDGDEPAGVRLEEGFTGTVTDKLGRERHYVNGKQVKGANADTERAKHAAVESAVASAVGDPTRLTPDRVRELAGHLRTLTKDRLQDLSRQVRTQIGGTKADLADRLLAHVHTQRSGKPKPGDALRDMPAAPPAVDYRHKDENHPVVKEMKADPGLNRKVAEYHGWAKARQGAADAFHATGHAASEATDAYNEAINATDHGTRDGIRRTNAALAAMKDARKQYRDAEGEFQKYTETPRERFLAAFGVADPSTFSRAYTDPKVQSMPHHADAIDSAEQFAAKLAGGGHHFPYRVIPAVNNREAYYDMGGKAPAIGFGSEARGSRATEIHTHELGHLIEFRKPGVMDRAKAFLAYRVGDEQPTDMGTLSDGGLMKGEMGRKDDFDRVFPGSGAYYVGKVYAGGQTEVVSMGLEQLFRAPANLAARDPELFHFLVSVLR